MPPAKNIPEAAVLALMGQMTAKELAHHFGVSLPTLQKCLARYALSKPRVCRAKQGAKHKPNEVVVEDGVARVGLRASDGAVRAWALVDPEDVPLLAGRCWTLRPGRNTDYVSSTKPTTVSLHRFLLGVSDPAVEVDHIDGNGLNNRRGNIRLATRNQNRHNLRHLKREGRTSQYPGVCWDKRLLKWRAQFGHVYLGLYATEEEAARVSSDWRKEHRPYSEADQTDSVAPKMSVTPRKTRAPKKSSRRGVALNSKSGTWRAQCSIGGRTIQLGSYVTEDAAAAAYSAHRENHVPHPAN